MSFYDRAKIYIKGTFWIAIVIAVISISINFIFVGYLLAFNLASWFRSPAGPIAERLLKVDHTSAGVETKALEDLFPEGSYISFHPKRDQSDLQRALKTAKFQCIEILPNRSHIGYLFCRNDNAGCTEAGDLRDWIITSDLVLDDVDRGLITNTRAFVKLSGRCLEIF